LIVYVQTQFEWRGRYKMKELVFIWFRQTARKEYWYRCFRYIRGLMY